MNNQNTNGDGGSPRDAALTALIGQVQSGKTRDYISNRILPQMKWYSSKSGENRKKYHFWMTCAIVLGAMIPVASVFADGPVWVRALIAVLGAAVTACNAYLSLHNFRDLWLTYRNTREALLRTLYCYFNDAGIFSQNVSQEEKDILLINVCEEEMSRENSGWISAMKK